MPSRPLTDNDVSLMLSKLNTSRDKCLFILGIKTGFRISELLCISVQDVSDGLKVRDMVTVKRCNMKGKHTSRTVPLHKDVRISLTKYLNDNPKLLLDPLGKLFPIKRLRAHRIICEAAKNAGIQGSVSTHSMRKTFGMGCYERSGKNVVAAQRALGHKSLSSTTHYLSIGQDEVDAVILGG